MPAASRPEQLACSPILICQIYNTTSLPGIVILHFEKTSRVRKEKVYDIQEPKIEQ